jgi:hypothetical protein
MRTVWETVRADALRRVVAHQVVTGLRPGQVIAGLIAIAELAGKVADAIKSAYQAEEARINAERAREEAERERQRAEAERQREDMRERMHELHEREIPDGSGQMDLFEHNRERIEHTC